MLSPSRVPQRLIQHPRQPHRCPHELHVDDRDGFLPVAVINHSTGGEPVDGFQHYPMVEYVTVLMSRP